MNQMKNNSKYNWNMVFFLTIIPLIGIFGTSIYVYHNGIVWQEPILLLVFWFISGMGITMGYHRLFAHKSFKTNSFVEWILMIFGSLAFENTILKWVSDHRKHHNFSDTKDDPYSIMEGFWHAHIGWIIKNTPEKQSRIKGVKDLESKPAIKFQNKYYFHIGIIVGFILPLIVGLIYNRPLGAVLWAGFLRVTLVHHATFFINSLCHFVGNRPYDYKSSARDSWFVSLFTFGEGYHNYHHTFQWDYRNGVKWFAFDPSKWIIKLLSFIGITYDLRETKEYLIWKNHISSIKDQLNESYNKSTENCKHFYQNKIDLLQKNIDNIFSSWDEMEKKYNNLKNTDPVNFKNFIKKLKTNRKEYMQELKEIKSVLNSIKFNINKNYLNSNLIIEGSDK